MVGLFGQHQLRPPPGGKHVLLQVGLVDPLPDVPGGALRLVIREGGVAVEVGLRLRERGAPQFPEPVHVPLLNVGGLGVHVDGEVEEIAQRQTLPAVVPRPGRRQHIQALHDQHVRAADHHFLAGHDVVGDVGVPGCPHFFGAALDLAHETQQRPAVIGLRETLPVQQLPPLQFGQRIEEAVRGDELHIGGAGPAAEHFAQDAGDGGFAHGYGPGNTDHERGPLGLLAQERGGGRMQLSCRLDVQVEEPGQRQVDIPDFLDVQGVAEPAKAQHILFIKGLFHLGCEPGPGLPVQLHERRGTLPVRFIALRSHAKDSAPRPAHREMTPLLSAAASVSEAPPDAPYAGQPV